MSWLVAVTKPQQETWGKENVERQGYNTYLPRFRDTIVHRGKIIQRTRCLFPRYLFVEVLEGSWSFLHSTYGLIGVVPAADGPAIIPTKEIDHLRSREDKDGLIVLPSKPKEARLGHGQKVRVMYGLFSGYYGICQGDSARDRVRLLLEFLGRKSEVLISRDALRAA